MNERGKFVVFEGAGGSGKGIQIEIAKNLLLGNGFQVIATREPGGVGPSEEIRQLIFTLKDLKLIGAEGQLVMFFTARKFWVDQLVAPNVNRGVHVLGDRSYPSTGAYQGFAEGGDQDKILKIADVIMGKYKPDAVLLLDVSSETSRKRRGKEVNGDPFDRETPEYLDRLVAGYREMAKTGWGGLDWYMVDGEPKPEIVSESIAKVLEHIFQKKLQR
ncbi:MAG TPA: dTMP kinase [Patescibacteria group bacterium]|nr:dTMP kinase [Patescibacteria group bacterium]